MKALVVDDALMYRVIIREFLETLGHSVVGEAQSGAEAVDQYRALRPDIVTLDISLPDMDGLSVLRQLREVDPKARVIMVSGNDQEIILAQARQYGAVAHLVKPVQLAALTEVLARIETSPS